MARLDRRHPGGIDGDWYSDIVPGHTRGSVVFEDDRGHLFSGDSLAWSEQRRGLIVFGSATWYSWQALTASMTRLARVARFEWVLPGHGKWGARLQR